MTRKIIDMQDEPEGTLLVFNEMIVTIQGGGITRVGGLKPTEAAEVIQTHSRKILVPVPPRPIPVSLIHSLPPVEAKPREKTFAEELKELHLSIVDENERVAKEMKEVEDDAPLGGTLIEMKDGDVITEEQYLREKAFMDRWWHGIGS